MPSKTVKTLILGALKSLGEQNFREFCDTLTDLEEEQRIGVCEVENKSRPEITKLLVSRFSSGALDITVRTLTDIGCINEAEKLKKEVEELESKCKPQRKAAKSPCDEPEPGPSSKPLQDRANKESKGKKGTPKATKLAKSGKESLLFGKYKDESFEWLLENDVWYAVYVVATHQMERDNGDQSQTERMKNKDALAEYVSHFPDVVEEVHFYKEGMAPVGFGKYENKTRKDLYDSNDEEEQSYVDWLWSKEKTGKGAQMEAMIQYIRHRDRNAPVSICPMTGPQRCSSMKRGPPPSSQPAAKKQRI